MSGAITVEFYGIPRQRAGRRELIVQAATLGGLLHAVQASCPDLRLVDDAGLAPQYRISVDGRRFLTELSEKLTPGERVLIVSADAGG